jgi:hypothetical protein
MSVPVGTGANVAAMPEMTVEVGERPRTVESTQVG